MRLRAAWLAGVAALALAACATPVRVQRVDARSVHRDLTRSAITSGEVSNPAEIVLRRRALSKLWEDDRAAALAALHEELLRGDDEAEELYALAELCFVHAERSEDRSYYLASAVYAWTFLFPGDAAERPQAFDPRVRSAVLLYNLALTRGLASQDGETVELRGGRFALPFGDLEVAFDPSRLRRGTRQLEDFVPAAELRIQGLRNRYRQPGLGAALVARARPVDPEVWDFVPPAARVAATAVLRLEDEPAAQLGAGQVRGRLEVFAWTDPEQITVDGEEVPLEIERSAALALLLARSTIWETELRGFLVGDLLGQRQAPRLVSLRPYQPNRIPVVFVHGTASSAGRWADMLNDLASDPELRQLYHPWFFAYDTGNPIAYSASVLRSSLAEAVERFDPEGRDAALRSMVVIGHSQGGILTKMTVIETGDRLWRNVSDEPFEDVDLPEPTRSLVRDAIFLEPLPFVDRVIFIATPHRGSYVAGSWLAHQAARLVRLPGALVQVGQDLARLQPQSVGRRRNGVLTAVDNMTPGTAFVEALASIPVAPGVHTHSIVPVTSLEGPLDDAEDGVVAYSSAHLEDVESELVVRGSGHSTQSDPRTVAEVRRLLRLHAAEVCAGVACLGDAPEAPGAQRGAAERSRTASPTPEAPGAQRGAAERSRSGSD